MDINILGGFNFAGLLCRDLNEASHHTCNQVRVEVTDSDKLTSLLRNRFNYDRKTFYKKDPRLSKSG
jgi:hypothetical protein